MLIRSLLLFVSCYVLSLPAAASIIRAANYGASYADSPSGPFQNLSGSLDPALTTEAGSGGVEGTASGLEGAAH